MVERPSLIDSYVSPRGCYRKQKKHRACRYRAATINHCGYPIVLIMIQSYVTIVMILCYVRNSTLCTQAVVFRSCTRVKAAMLPCKSIQLWVKGYFYLGKWPKYYQQFVYMCQKQKFSLDEMSVILLYILLYIQLDYLLNNKILYLIR